MTNEVNDDPNRPIDPKDKLVASRLQKIANRVSNLIFREVKEDMGFALLMFPWAKNRAAQQAEIQYVSNAPRDYMHEAMRSTVQKWDKTEKAGDQQRAFHHDAAALGALRAAPPEQPKTPEEVREEARKAILLEAVIQKTRAMADQGKVIEMGWNTMFEAVMPADAPPDQKTEMRKAFYMGCDFLFDVMTKMPDDSDTFTEQDGRRMANIDSELAAFRMEFYSNVRSTPTTKQ